MAIKRSLFVLMASSILLLTIGGKNAYAYFSSSRAAQTMMTQWMSNEIIVSALDNEQYFPAVAYNSNHDEYLVVWHNKWAGGSRDVYAQRISSKGELLSWFSVTTASMTNDIAQPDVAYDPVNDRYLVVFIYDYNGDGSDWDVYGRIIPWNGPSSSFTEIWISAKTSHQWTPKVAYAGTQGEFLVVWANEDQSGTTPMYISGRRIKASDGTFINLSDDLTISNATDARTNPDISYNLARNEYMVVYDDGSDIFGTRLKGDTLPLGSGEFSIAGFSPDIEINPAVAACNHVGSNGQYLVAWQSDQHSANDAIYARFIDGLGTNGNIKLIDDTTSPEREPEIACSLSGKEYLLAWETRYTHLKYGIWGRVVHANESMETQFAIVHPGTSTDRLTPAVAASLYDYLVVWKHQRNTTYQDIHGRIVSPHKIFLPLTSK